MTVSASGIVRWTAPPNPPVKAVPVIIRVKSGSGKEVIHAFDLAVD
jgi:hypothetical protein